MHAFRLGVVAPGDPDDVRTWSGVPHHMVRALRRIVAHVEVLPAGDLSFSPWGMRWDRWSRRLLGYGIVPGQNSRTLARLGREVGRTAAETGVDAILGITVDPLLAHLECDVPIVHHSDATFASLAEYYPPYTHVWRRCRERGMSLTRRALLRARACTFPSRWAAHSAIEDYDVDPSKVHVIPYGANLESVPVAADLRPEVRRVGACRLLFVGGAWGRKGGDIVWSTFCELLDRGADVELTVVGCDPGVRHERLTIVPFLNKQVPADLERYRALWRESTFLFVPSLQETFGAIFPEAAANGLPVVSRVTGGIPEAVAQGESGILLPDAATARDYADAILALIDDPETYDRLARGARDRFEHELNWDTWAERTVQVIENVVSS